MLKAITSVDNHPLGPPTKESKHNLRKKQCAVDPQG